MAYRFSQHGLKALENRGIPLRLAEKVLDHPQQVVHERGNRYAFQSKIDFGGGRIFLLRVIVDHSPDPPVVVTAYRTSKISKYWNTQ